MPTMPFYSPKFRAFDANGDPLAGGLLYSYAAGTSTPLDTFTTRAGDIANTNPVELDANGEADVWTTPGVLYKFVLADADDIIQWTVDNVPSAGTGDDSGGGGGSGTGAVATTEPGGRLSLTSATPLTTADVTGAATVFYVPFKHDQVPLYDGSEWALFTVVGELSQTASDSTKSPAAVTADATYDLFVWDDSGTLRLSRGPPWSSTTIRGTGGGTSELEVVDFRRVNKHNISNGPAAQRGLYVGSIYSSGSLDFNDSASFRLLWNAYNRVLRQMRVTDSTSTWTYSTNTWRQANGAVGNRFEVVLGLAEEPLRVEVVVKAFHSAGTANLGVGIGLDSTTTPSSAALGGSRGAAAVMTDTPAWAFYEGIPGLGRHTFAWLERSGNTGGTTTWHGTTIPLGTWTSGMSGHLFA